MITVGNSDYNGSYLQFLYQVFTTLGNEVIMKGSARVLTGIAKKMALPKLSQTENPWGDYTDDEPATDTVTTTYSERSVDPQKMTLFEKMLPSDMQAVWDKWQPVGDFTNLRNNPAFIADVLELYRNKGGGQLSKLFFQGDKTLAAGNPMNKFNGIITRAKADASVINPPAIGNITQANVVDVIASVWQACPAVFRDDPFWTIKMNDTDFQLLQLFNNDVKKGTVGVLNEEVQNLFLNKRIESFLGMPKNYVLGAKAVPNSDESNLFFAFYVETDDENPRMDYVANAGRKMFIRFDTKADANYREASELVLYEPV